MSVSCVTQECDVTNPIYRLDFRLSFRALPPLLFSGVGGGGGVGVVSAGSFPKTAAGNRALYRFSEAYKIAELLIAKTNHKEKEGICFSWIRKKSDQL